MTTSRLLAGASGYSFKEWKGNFYSDDDLKSWSERLAATNWRETYVYFMHEPTAPAYAQTLMRLGSDVLSR